MAKSIRSKRRRRMRSVKRKIFEPKVLASLKVAIKNDVLSNPDVEMKDTCTDTDVETKSKGRPRKINMYENGQYPTWMNQRVIRRVQVKMKKAKRVKGKKSSKW